MNSQIDRITPAKFSEFLDELLKPKPKFELCERVNYGNNGNFVRYVPVGNSNAHVLKTFLTQIHMEKTAKMTKKIALQPKNELGRGKVIDFSA